MIGSGTIKPPSHLRAAVIWFIATVIAGALILWAVLPRGVWSL